MGITTKEIEILKGLAQSVPENYRDWVECMGDTVACSSCCGLDNCIYPCSPILNKEFAYQPAMSLDKMSVGVVLGRLEACGVCNFSLDLKSHLDNKDTLRTVLAIRKRYYAELEAIKM